MPTGTRDKPGPAKRLDGFDAVRLRETTGAFLANMFETQGRPDWFLVGTSIAARGMVPSSISIDDYLRIIANLWENAANPHYYIDYLLAGVPFYYGALDLGLRYAPNIQSAFELIVEYADDRPGFHHHRLTSESGRLVLELVPTTDLGAGRPILVESPLLFYARLAAAHSGKPLSDKLVGVTHAEHKAVGRLSAAMGCEVRFGSDRDAISIGEAAAGKQNMAFDEALWRIALARCREEVKAKAEQEILATIRNTLTEMMAQTGRPPRLEAAARSLGTSGRTLIRRLRSQGTTFQSLVDDILQQRGTFLLATTDHTIARISEELGFPDVSSFHRSFRRWVGKTPAEYRKELLIR